jgi:hypothetical protein
LVPYIDGYYVYLFVRLRKVEGELANLLSSSHAVHRLDRPGTHMIEHCGANIDFATEEKWLD